MQQFYELDIFMQKPEMSPETKRVMLLLTTLPRSECGGLGFCDAPSPPAAHAVARASDFGDEGGNAKTESQLNLGVRLSYSCQFWWLNSK